MHRINYPIDMMNAFVNHYHACACACVDLLCVAGIQYKRDNDISMSCMTTNNMTGARLMYHIPMNDRGYVRAIAASYDIRPVGSVKNLSLLDICLCISISPISLSFDAMIMIMMV